MRGLVGWLLPALALGLVGCPSGGPECEEDGDCPSGRYCVAGQCVFDCATDVDCREGYRCTVHGRCEQGCVRSNGGVEGCDGVDNDCDGQTDEDFAELGAACSNGDCPEGLWVCSADGLAAVCDGPVPAADDAVCDGLDDDCDGQTDEDAQPRECPLQQGFCAGTIETCLGADGWSGCDYGPDYTADQDMGCDQLDTDCDGETDEDAEPVLAPEDGASASDGLDNNCNKLVDEPGGVMVPAANSPGVWIDAYESAVFENRDCSGPAYGQANDDYPATWPAVGDAQVDLYACSVPGVIPSGHLSWYRADRACRAQGKRLCSRSEWQQSCHAGQVTFYPYGMLFTPSICNDALTGAGEVIATGQHQQCTADGLTFDMSGNLAEWILDAEPDDPDWYVIGGYGYECYVCRSHGINCGPCDRDDPDDVRRMQELSSCSLTVSSRNEFAREMVLPFFGGRCCLDGP